MAVRDHQININRKAGGGYVIIGIGVAASLVIIALLTIGALLVAGDVGSGFGGTSLASIWRVALFTFWQASLSALLSLAIALPVARACWRRSLAWHANKLILLSFLTVVMPTTVAVSGLLGIWGQTGLVSSILARMGAAPLPPIYGLGAVLLAHVFFNAPLMLRVLLTVFAAIPAEQMRLAAQWGLGDWQRFRIIEWPRLRAVIPGLLALVFLLCFTSFSLILMLGGGPALTTLEVNIYTALRFDFDLRMAASLSLVQLSICAVVVAFLARFGTTTMSGVAPARSRRLPQRGDGNPVGKAIDAFLLAGVMCLAVAPVFSVIFKGVSNHMVSIFLWPSFQRALLATLGVAVTSGILATGVALLMAASRVRLGPTGQWSFDLAVSLYLAVSAIVLGTGAFILLRGIVDVFLLAPVLVLMANMLVALPFAYRVVQGKMALLAKTQDKLCLSLDVRGWRRFRLVTLPAMAPEIGFAAGLSAALSVGDLTVIALFGSQQFQTLPWLLYQMMARYRTGDAAALALILLLITILIFVGFALGARWLQRRSRHAAG